MNSRQIKTLAIVLIILLAALVATTLSDRQGDVAGGGLIFPNLKAEINGIAKVSISKAGESLTVTNDSGKWVLAERQDYPVDTGKLRQLLLALANATKLEQKTSNPEMYRQLGVEDTGANSSGTEIRVRGASSESSVILGNLAQKNYRYARIPGQPESWLIDQNPNLPDGVSGWLLPEILDIDTSRVQSVTITHSDGETIFIEKKDREASSFDVADIPDGRELSYAGVVNAIAGVLSGLTLQDVAQAAAAETGESSTQAVFTTFDGLEITIESSLRDENTWITVSATQSESNHEPEPDLQAEPQPEEATVINERLGGWEYQIQRYKGDQLRRRRDDILKAEE